MLLERHADRFASLFGVSRGGGLDRSNSYVRTLRRPGLMLTVRRIDGRPLNVRVVRHGDRTSAGRVHEQPFRRSQRPGDECLVEFLDPTSGFDPVKFPHGHPTGGPYFVGSLREHPELHRVENFEFHTEHPEGHGLSPAQYAVLLDWLDQQIG